jgi:hypothetical protein
MQTTLQNIRHSHYLKYNKPIRSRQKFTANIIVSQKKTCPKHNIKLIKKITTDTIIDGICIYGKYTSTDDVSAISCTSLFTSCVFNNIFLNKNATSDNAFIHRGIQLFTFGLFSNSISGLIYTQPFNLLFYLKYIIYMSMSMGILSNIRYTIIHNFENHINASLHQSIIIRIVNNILGVIQQSTVLTFV